MLPLLLLQVAVTSVTLIDGTGAPARTGMTVLSRGDRIVAIGPTGAVRLPAGATIVDGRNKFLIPGLCDAHVHLDHGPAVIPQFVAHGVTCVQVMWGPRGSIAPGALVFPSLETVAGEVPESAPVASAGRFVDSLAGLGATLLKIGSDHDRAWLEALARAARARKLPIVGHLTNSEGVPGAIRIGQARIEHVDTPFLIAASAHPGALLRRWNQAVHSGDRGGRNEIVDEALAGITAKRMAALMRSLRASRIALTPTLVNLRAMAMAADSNFAADPRTALVPDSVRRAWAEVRPPVLDAGERERAQRIYQAKLRLVAAAQREGVLVLAGTDAGSDYRYNGSSLYDELALLVDAGLSPTDALLAATRNPAAVFGHRDYGTIAVGRRADMVLLGADPRTDIRNVALVEAVLLRGRLLGDSLLRALRQ